MKSPKSTWLLFITGLVLVLFWSRTGLALHLGPMRIESRLGEPFSATIPLDFQTGDSEAGLGLVVGDVADYAKSGFHRPQMVDGLRLELAGQGGERFLRVSSVQPLRDPFFNLLVKASVGHGANLRHYPVMLTESAGTVIGAGPRLAVPPSVDQQNLSTSSWPVPAGNRTPPARKPKAVVAEVPAPLPATASEAKAPPAETAKTTAKAAEAKLKVSGVWAGLEKLPETVATLEETSRKQGEKLSDLDDKRERDKKRLNTLSTRVDKIEESLKAAPPALVQARLTILEQSLKPKTAGEFNWAGLLEGDLPLWLAGLLVVILGAVSVWQRLHKTPVASAPPAVSPSVKSGLAGRFHLPGRLTFPGKMTFPGKIDFSRKLELGDWRRFLPFLGKSRTVIIPGETPPKPPGPARAAAPVEPAPPPPVVPVAAVPAVAVLASVVTEPMPVAESLSAAPEPAVEVGPPPVFASVAEEKQEPSFEENSASGEVSWAPAPPVEEPVVEESAVEAEPSRVLAWKSDWRAEEKEETVAEEEPGFSLQEAIEEAVDSGDEVAVAGEDDSGEAYYPVEEEFAVESDAGSEEGFVLEGDEVTGESSGWQPEDEEAPWDEVEPVAEVALLEEGLDGYPQEESSAVEYEVAEADLIQEEDMPLEEEMSAGGELVLSLDEGPATPRVEETPREEPVAASSGMLGEMVLHFSDEEGSEPVWKGLGQASTPVAEPPRNGAFSPALADEESGEPVFRLRLILDQPEARP
ncbi:MAG: hypothetical protein HQL56_07325 [Magnetococcales bacterium]|nr:hypothetical protein [Magnetococcales bacterium]